MNSRKSAAIFQPSESQLHRTVAELLEWALHPQTVWTTFPAGWGHLPKATAGRLRGAGLKAGFPDILIFHYNGQHLNGVNCTKVVGLELKAKGRKPSAAQQLMFPRLRNIGIDIYVCQSVDDVIASLFKSNIPLRGRFWENFRETTDETRDPDAEARRAEELA